MMEPTIIQGGMGVAISAWPLARAVSMRGQLGVVSGTGIDTVLVRRLQTGDLGGHVRFALDHFPLKDIAEEVWERYFIPGGKRPNAPFKAKPMPSIRPSRVYTELVMVANFVEVFLAKHGHDGVVGINLLEKIQLPTIASLFGAMLAKVDYVLMGAGIPRAIPAVLDQLASGQVAELKIDVAGAQPGESFATRLDPKQYGPAAQGLPRPKFIAIVASSALASTLARKSTGRVDGFVVEGSTAGGHNAPPRGPLQLDEAGEPIYGPRDEPDLEAIRELGLPFWLAGSFGHPGGLNDALSRGAQGIQVGTPFAFCEESGMDPKLKALAIQKALEGPLPVFTDPYASPTGFPFKVLDLDGSLAKKSVYAERGRICDLGYLRQLYRKENGTVGYRCAAEPVEDFIEKGGDPEEAAGRKCLCNGLLATAGFPQVRKDGKVEPPILTAGNSVAELRIFLEGGRTSFSADDVIDRILQQAQARATG